METNGLPVLPTMGVGSYASPAWLHAAREQIRDQRFGADDIEETLEDATRIAVADQVEAGLDVISDGEMRRQRFVYELYDRLSGLRRVPPGRRVGVPGHDMAPRFATTERVTGPEGLGVVAEFRLLRRLAPGRPLKVALPGPLTFATAIEPAEGYAPGSAGVMAMLGDLASLVQRELMLLTAAGAAYIQLDEPGFCRPPSDVSLEEAASVINRTLDGVPGRIAVHVCFGNNAGRPSADRSLGRLFPAIQSIQCRQLVLEFANRQMAEVDRLAELSASHEVAAGVVDVKSFHLETAADVAARIRQVLRFVPASRLTVTADCGFSALPRWLARAKLRAMVAGARIVRESLEKP
jgi:5-methyltetrahydropteroyltriglutamate--homocysteine methyltransferase